MFEQQALVTLRGLVQSGQLLSPGHLQEARTMTGPALSVATLADRLFTVDIEGRPYFPAFFVSGKIGRNVLEEISELLGPLPEWQNCDFFISWRGSSGDISPLEALKKRNEAEVKRVARALAEEHVG